MRTHGRALLLALGLALALGVALWPQATYASCGADPGCYIDEGVVTLLRFLAQLGWFLNGSLLLLSRWIEEQRTWLINDVMAALFAGLLKGSMVAWAQAVVIAVVLFVIGFSLRAIAELNWVDARRAIRNGVIALIVFSYGAQLMAASETARVELSMAASELAVDSLSAAGGAQMLTGGSSRPGDLMAPIATIYPGEACGGVVPARSSSSATTIFINDIAANYLFADVEDIHCAEGAENAPALPTVFWEGGTYPTASMGPPENGSPVIFEGYYRTLPGQAIDSPDRQRIVSLAMDGAVRQLFGLFLTIPAVIEQVIQLIFALGLATIWLSLTIGLVFALFVPTEGMLFGIGRSAVELVKSSLLTTIGVTLVSFVVRIVAGSSGVNAGLVAFIGLLCLVVLVVILVNTVRVVFRQVASMSGITLGAAPAALLGTLGGVGMVAAMAMRAAPAAVSAGREAGMEAEARARASGASDDEAKAAGHRAAIAARNAALRTSATRTMMDIGRATTDAAGFLQDPLRQSMRWQDRADAERRQQEIIAAMDANDEARPASQAAPQPAHAAAGAAAGGASAPQSSVAARLRGLPPASPSNPDPSQTTALNGQPAMGSDTPTPAERQAAEEVSAVGTELERAKAALERVQQQLATAQGRAAVQKPSALNEREIRRLEQEAAGIAGQVARLRQQLDEAERLQRQVRADGEAQQVWRAVQATERQRNPATGATPQRAIRTGIGAAQQQLERAQQQLDRRPAGDPTVDDDRAWLHQQQAAVGSLRRWNETLARPDASATDRAEGEAAIRKIREDAERERNAARQAGNVQREQIAGGVASLAGAMLPAAAAGAPSAPAAGGAQAPAQATTGPAAAAAAGAPSAPAAGGAQAPAQATTGPAAAAAAGAPSAPAAGGAQAPAQATTRVSTGAAPRAVPAGMAPAAPAPASSSTAGAEPPVSSPPAPAAAAPGMASGAPVQPTLAQRLRAQQDADVTPTQAATGPAGAGAVAAPPTPVASAAPAPAQAATGPAGAGAVAAPPTPVASAAPAPTQAATGPGAPAGSAAPAPGAPAAPAAPAGTPDHATVPPGGYGSPAPGDAPAPVPAPAVRSIPAASARVATSHTNTTPGIPSAPGIGSPIPASSPATNGAQAPAGAGTPSAADGQASRRRLRVGGVERRER